MVEPTFCTLLMEEDPVVNCSGYIAIFGGCLPLLFASLLLKSVVCAASSDVQDEGAAGEYDHFYMHRKAGQQGKAPASY